MVGSTQDDSDWKALLFCTDTSGRTEVVPDFPLGKVIPRKGRQKCSQSLLVDKYGA